MKYILNHVAKYPHVWVIESWQRSGRTMKGPYHWDIADYTTPAFSTKRAATNRLWFEYGDEKQLRVAKYVREKP